MTDTSAIFMLLRICEVSKRLDLGHASFDFGLLKDEVRKKFLLEVIRIFL